MNNTRIINISMPQDLYELLNRAAVYEDRSKSSIIRQALKSYGVQKYGPKDTNGLNAPNT